MFDLIRPYITIVKLYGVIVVILALAAYIGLLHYRISSAQEENRFLQSSITKCSSDRSRLRSVVEVQSRNMDELDQYYRNRKCLELKDGELSDEEMQLQ